MNRVCNENFLAKWFRYHCNWRNNEFAKASSRKKQEQQETQQEQKKTKIQNQKDDSKASFCFIKFASLLLRFNFFVLMVHEARIFHFFLFHVKALPEKIKNFYSNLLLKISMSKEYIYWKNDCFHYDFHSIESFSKECLQCLFLMTEEQLYHYYTIQSIIQSQQSTNIQSNNRAGKA